MLSKVKRRLLSVALSTALLMILLAIGAGNVFAASYPEDGQNPAYNGCANTAWNPSTWNDGAIQIDLRFSSACMTAWGRSTTSNYITYTLTATRLNDGVTQTTNYEWGGAYTMQLYDGVGLSVRSCVSYYWTFFPWSTGGGCTGAY